VQRILREQGPKIVQAVWQPGAAQPVAPPDDEPSEATEQLAPDDAARTLFGLLKAPSTSHAEADPQLDTPESAVPIVPPAPYLTRDNVRRLQSALHELRECRRLIDQALKNEAA